MERQSRAARRRLRRVVLHRHRSCIYDREHLLSVGASVRRGDRPNSHQHRCLDSCAQNVDTTPPPPGPAAPSSTQEDSSRWRDLEADSHPDLQMQLRSIESSMKAGFQAQERVTIEFGKQAVALMQQLAALSECVKSVTASVDLLHGTFRTLHDKVRSLEQRDRLAGMHSDTRCRGTVREQCGAVPVNLVGGTHEVGHPHSSHVPEPQTRHAASSLEHPHRSSLEPTWESTGSSDDTGAADDTCTRLAYLLAYHRGCRPEDVNAQLQCIRPSLRAHIWGILQWDHECGVVADIAEQVLALGCEVPDPKLQLLRGEWLALQERRVSGSCNRAEWLAYVRRFLADAAVFLRLPSEAWPRCLGE
jgi:hypothetical protein